MKKVFKYIFIFFVSLVIIVGIGGYFLRKNIKEILLHRLLKEVETTFGNYYHVTYSNIELSVENSFFTINITNPVFRTDTTQKEFLTQYPPIFFKADHFMVGNINIRQLILGQTLKIEQIELANPNLLILTNTLHTHKTTETKPQKTKPNRKLITDVLVDKLTITKGDVNLIHFYNLQDTLYYGEDINLDITKAEIKTQAQEGILEASTIGNIVFSMNKVRLHPSYSPYSFWMQSIKIDVSKNTVNCRKVVVYPEKSLLKLSRKAAYQKTFAQIAIGNLFIKGIDYKKLAQKEVNIKQIELSNAHFNLLRNKEKKLNKSLVKKSFQQLLANIHVPIKIDGIKLHNLHLTFKLYFPTHKEPALIQLKHINGTLSEINTYKGHTKPIRLHATATIMNKGKLTFNATIPQHKKTHSYNGVITAMPFTDWNQVLSKMAPVKIESGMVHRIQFSGIAGTSETSGKLTLTYSNLKATIYKKQVNGELKKAKLMSLVANTFIQTNNPAKGDSLPTSTPFYFKKEPYQGQIMLWVGGLLDGIEGTLLNEKVKQKVDAVKEKKKKEKVR
jgi:hypothetical protein